jgi:predicted phage tail protein
MLQAIDGPTVGQLLVAMLGAIPLLGIMGWTAVKIFGPIGQALARRISGGNDGEFLERRVEALSVEMEQVKQQLAETHERLDFTERLLAQEKHPEQLRRGPTS